MINFLRGTIFQSHNNPVTLLVGGVGYAVYVGEKLKSDLKGESSTDLYIHTHIREDSFDLFGFISRHDLILFELLLTVSGIGPKTALLVIDRGAASIEQAVQKADVNFFTSIPRLGTKNAQKIIIELKSKLGSITDLSLTEDVNEEEQTVVDALVTMGFAKKEVLVNLKHLTPDDATIQLKMKRLLKYLGKS